MPFSVSKKSSEIKSSKTGRNYSFVPGESLQFDDSVHAQIAKVCDEPEIYDNVFAAIFKGKRYSVDSAKVFTKLVSEGGLNKNRFDWLILHEGLVVGTIGIKSLDGEIGYWQSNKHPGVMTSAARQVCSLAKEAGFPSLWAYVKKTNVPSIKVLENAGFTLEKDLPAKQEDAFGYRIVF